MWVYLCYNSISMTENYELYRCMLLIRRFEERALAEFSAGKLFGTTHAYIGQEADAAAIFSAARPEDIFWSSHRCHGHFLAYGGDPYRLAAELMGKATGLVGGRGGSQHIHWGNFYSNGIQGGIVPVAAGMALAQKVQKTGGIVAVFTGDGTLGEGTLYESLNLASLWSLPVLFVVENNHYAQTTPIEKGVAGSISARFEAFGIRTFELESSDVLAIQPLAEEAMELVRGGNQPAALILHTHRFAAHSKGDDPRDRETIAGIRAHFDPLTIHAPRLSQVELEQAEADVSAQIESAFSRAYAGLSFTYFQSAFQGWAERAGAVDRAFEAAGQSMMADDRDPAAHWAMGRALWLRSRHDQCVVELEQAVELSPNFALAHYTLAFVHSQAGDPAAAIRASDYSRSLSPFDPLLFGMLGARAMALVRMGNFEEAAAWAVQAADRPNAHAHIQAIAAFSLALAGSMDEAQSYAAAIRKTSASYTLADFFGAFRFDAKGLAAFRKGAGRLGMK